LWSRPEAKAIRLQDERTLPYLVWNIKRNFSQGRLTSRSREVYLMVDGEAQLSFWL